jgi:methylenetetrahydrofolate dehydrogenase (NADP+)/methenyltetrahydrofolate cyclohydrolase
VATTIDGRAVAARVRERVKREVDELGRLGLATILVGDDPASEIYIRTKHRAAGEVGIEAIDIRLPATTTPEDLSGTIRDLNADGAIDGILVQTPLPPQIDEITATNAVDPPKDVDGFHPVNAGNLYRGRPTLVPATAAGVMELLDAYEVDLEGAHAVVVGRSDRVGKPLAHLLLQRNATVTVCHSRTRDLAAHTRAADVLVVAIGRARHVTKDMIRARATVVDVGMNRTEEGLVGDVDAAAAEVAGLLTPVPGGVGPMTIAMLLSNTVRAARARRGLAEAAKT